MSRNAGYAATLVKTLKVWPSFRAKHFKAILWGLKDILKILRSENNIDALNGGDVATTNEPVQVPVKGPYQLGIDWRGQVHETKPAHFLKVSLGAKVLKVSEGDFGLDQDLIG